MGLERQRTEKHMNECMRKYKGKEEIIALPEPGMDETSLKVEKHLTLQVWSCGPKDS